MFMFNPRLILKKMYCSDYKKKILFIGTVHHQRQWSSAVAPRHQRRLNQSQRQTHHPEDLHINPTERSAILHQCRSHSTITAKTQVHADLVPSTTRSNAATTGLCLRFQISVTNHQHQQPHPSSSTSRNATIHSALTFSSDNGSTSPRPAATPQTPPPLPSHRRAQAESRSPASCAVADSSDNSSHKLGKQENRSCKHN
jgi:hypothetical protein